MKHKALPYPPVDLIPLPLVADTKHPATGTPCSTQGRVLSHSASVLPASLCDLLRQWGEGWAGCLLSVSPGAYWQGKAM